MTRALVIGAGPAGLMAAETLASAGCAVTIADAMPSVGRKFLMAGKSGLNLTNDRPFDEFCAVYDAPELRPMLQAFGPDAVRAWAEGLGQPLFIGSSGHVFPRAMKASPLLRAWMVRLAALRVQLRTRCRWTGVLSGPDDMRFGDEVLHVDVVVLALGGASWRRLGSDGLWTQQLPGIELAPFRPSNVGFAVEWSDHMGPVLGQPVKPVTLIAGDMRRRGEFVLSRTGIEGSGVYALSRALRDGANLFLDLVPDLSEADVRARLGRSRGKASVSNFLRKALRLDRVRLALLNELARPFPEDLRDLPVKRLSVPLKGPRPMDEAISTAGGVAWNAMDAGLMLRSHPGVFVAGEMLDWDAPTGGYLLTACLATGRWAGNSAARWAAERGGTDVSPPSP